MTSQANVEAIVASPWRRGAAFLLDAILIFLLNWFVILPFFQELYYTKAHAQHYQEPMQILTLSLFICWALYVVGFNASSMRATPMQYLFRMQVCTVFGERLSILVAGCRFIIFAAPVIIFLVLGVDQILGTLPLEEPLTELDQEQFSTSAYFMPLLAGVILLQCILLLPCITGRSDKILWDQWCHSCVLLRDPAIVSAANDNDRRKKSK